MKKPAKPKDHHIWFIRRIRKDEALNKLNKRQQRILEKVRRWEKYHGAIDQIEWDFKC